MFCGESGKHGTRTFLFLPSHLVSRWPGPSWPSLVHLRWVEVEAELQALLQQATGVDVVGVSVLRQGLLWPLFPFKYCLTMLCFVCFPFAAARRYDVAMPQTNPNPSISGSRLVSACAGRFHACVLPIPLGTTRGRTFLSRATELPSCTCRAHDFCAELYGFVPRARRKARQCLRAIQSFGGEHPRHYGRAGERQPGIRLDLAMRM